jgi:hypothetical protein
VKTSKLKKWVLLEQSGELSDRRRQKLEQCAGVEEERAALRALTEAAAKEPVDELSPWTVTRIQSRLREEHVHSPLRVLKPVLITSACLLLVTTLLPSGEPPSNTEAVVSNGSQSSVWDELFEEELSELEGLISSMSGDQLAIEL